MYLNLVFHYLSAKNGTAEEWNISPEKFFEIISQVEKLMEKKETKFSQYRIYFDDGERSFVDLLLPRLNGNLIKFTFAITTDFLGKKGFLTAEELKQLKKMGARIVSHGVSHAALAVYDKTDSVLLPASKGGRYKNSPFGKNLLKENEIKYQYLESHRVLSSLFGGIDEYVFPFGLYNNQSIQINTDLNLYRFLSTCDSGLDSGKNLRPRYLVYNTKSIPTIIGEISSLK